MVSRCSAVELLVFALLWSFCWIASMVPKLMTDIIQNITNRLHIRTSLILRLLIYSCVAEPSAPLIACEICRDKTVTRYDLLEYVKLSEPALAQTTTVRFCLILCTDFA